MLEVKNLVKEYRTKNGVTTKALDDVSLVFPEKGMVFILGKSGSGKSTLLNVCGGLDKADSGEIIIKGKSSKDFSSQDFDSYRNTYVGFVFQEYNILEEFTVEENIALALELQDKKRDRDTINKILEDVDLKQFASRKPNTLSGGQKQRVAIARALVKEPEIIMADEPTGALDSKTGQQVFDTLKSLSKDKLVIVISHDRDFAEQYADRIIELKDGKILSDMTRSDDPELNKNLQFFGTDTVCIKNGAQVTDAELKKIADFLNRAGGTAVISTSREKINDFKQDRPEMDVGEFQNIKEQPKPKEYAPEKLIRSHLPLKHAVRVGAGSLKTKPVRLVFTILLSIVAFILFGLMSTVMLFDERKVTKETFRQSDYAYIALEKQYIETVKSYNNGVLNNEYSTNRDTKFTEEDLNKLSQEYGKLLAVYTTGGGYGGGIPFENVSLSTNAKQFYSEGSGGFILATDSLQKTYGAYPVEADEVMLPSFFFDAFKLESTQYTDAEGNTVKIRQESDLIYNESRPVPVFLRIRFGGKSINLKIVGIYRSTEAPDDYAELKQAATTGSAFNGDYMVTYNWQNERESGLYNYLGVSQKFIDGNKETFAASSDNNSDKNYFNYSEALVSYGINDGDAFINGETNRLAPYKATPGLTLLDIYDFDGNKLDSLKSAQFAISHTYIASALNGKLRDYYYSSEYNKRISQAVEAADEQYRSANPEPVTQSTINDWNYRLQDIAYTAEENYRKANREPLQEEYGDDYDAYIEAYTTWVNGLNSAREAAEQAFKADNPEPQIAPGQEGKEDEWYTWKNGFYAARNEAEQAFDEKNPYPEQNDYDSYEEWEIAYREYNEKREAAIKAAEDKYISQIPEPEWDHKQWEYGLDKAQTEAREAADPFGGKFDELMREIESLSYYNYETGERASDEDIMRIIKKGYGVYAACGFTVSDITLHGDRNNTDRTATLAGYYINFDQNGLYLSDDLYSEFYQAQQHSWYEERETKYVQPKDAMISKIFVPYDKTDALMERLIALTEKVNEDDSVIAISNPLMGSLNMAFGIMDILGKVFLYAGIVLAVFAFLLMFNFISASITAKKKEIGILRAIGARTVDVFKIFFSEALIIALICIVVAMAGTFGTCILINYVIIDAMNIALFVFTPLTAVFIIAIALVTAFLSTILPIAKYSKKPPVESIRAL